MSDEPITADAFGGGFPVCSQEDKVAIEEGFKKAMAWSESVEGKAYDSRPPECSCALIARLLNGTASYGDMVTLGIDLARQMYFRKMAGIALMSIMEGAQGLPSMEPAPGKKKEWVN